MFWGANPSRWPWRCCWRPYLIHAGTSSIWDSNEAFYVETPREMMEHGTHLVPPSTVYQRLNKPPLAYWLVIIAYRLGGVGVWSQRMVIATAFALATLLVVWQLAFRLTASRTAAWAAAPPSTTPFPWIFVRWADGRHRRGAVVFHHGHDLLSTACSRGAPHPRSGLGGHLSRPGFHGQGAGGGGPAPDHRRRVPGLAPRMAAERPGAPSSWPRAPSR